MVEALSVAVNKAIADIQSNTYTGPLKAKVADLKTQFAALRDFAYDPLNHPLGSSVTTIKSILGSPPAGATADPSKVLSDLIGAPMPAGKGSLPSEFAWWNGDLKTPYKPGKTTFARAAAESFWEYDQCFTTTNRMATTVAATRSRTQGAKAMSVSGFAGGKKSSGKIVDEVGYNKVLLKKYVDQIKHQLDGGFVIVAGTASGGPIPTNWQTQPNHYLLVFAYEGDTFVFWDSDSQATKTSLGRAFGKLFYAKDRLSTARDDADLETSGSNHVHSGPGEVRHRYQVTTLQGFPH
jgi:hypothetical protein